MVLARLIAICSVILTGLSAGSMLGTGLSLYSSRRLPEAAWTRRFQLEDSLFAKVMPPLSQAQLLFLIAAVLFGHGSSRAFFTAATVFSLVVLAITLGLEVPLNRQIQSWVPGAAPATWRAIRDRWLWNHLYRSAAALLAFVCCVLAI